MQGVVWGRGAGEGIGLSGHKNEYKAGIRIGNWVEEQFGREAPMIADTLKVRRQKCGPAEDLPLPTPNGAL
jgi:hypothetical protein